MLHIISEDGNVLPITAKKVVRRYTRSVHTNVQEVWLRNGWAKPDRSKQYAVARELNLQQWEYEGKSPQD